MPYFKVTEKLKSFFNIVTMSYTGKFKNEHGDTVWYLNGKLHREDGPAIERLSGDRFWYRYGLLHRENGPAIERNNGTKEWWLNGYLHRENGPAIVFPDGRKQYWIKDDSFITSRKISESELHQIQLMKYLICKGNEKLDDKVQQPITIDEPIKAEVTADLKVTNRKWRHYL